MSISDIQAADRRGEILIALTKDAHGEAIDGTLHRHLNSKGVGYRCSSSQVRTDLAWLAAQGLVEVEILRDDVHAVTLTREGRDVAEGNFRVPGTHIERRGR